MKKMVGLDRYLILDCEETFFIVYKGKSIPFNPGRYLIDTREYSPDSEIYIEEKVNMYSVPFFPSPIRVYETMNVNDVNVVSNLQALKSENRLLMKNIVNQIAKTPLEPTYIGLTLGNPSINDMVEFLGGRNAFTPTLPDSFDYDEETAVTTFYRFYHYNGDLLSRLYLNNGGQYYPCTFNQSWFDKYLPPNNPLNCNSFMFHCMYHNIGTREYYSHYVGFVFVSYDYDYDSDYNPKAVKAKLYCSTPTGQTTSKPYTVTYDSKLSVREEQTFDSTVYLLD